MRLDPRLHRGLDKEGKAVLLSEIRSSKNLREILIKVLTDEIESAILSDESVDIYKNPNALALVADHRGYRRGLRHCIKLLETEDKEHE